MVGEDSVTHSLSHHMVSAVVMVLVMFRCQSGHMLGGTERIPTPRHAPPPPPSSHQPGDGTGETSRHGARRTQQQSQEPSYKRGLSRVGSDDIYRTKLISRRIFSFTRLLINQRLQFTIYASLQPIYLINIQGRFNDLQMKVFYEVQSRTKRSAALHYAPTFVM